MKRTAIRVAACAVFVMVVGYCAGEQLLMWDEVKWRESQRDSHAEDLAAAVAQAVRSSEHDELVVDDYRVRKTRVIESKAGGMRAVAVAADVPYAPAGKSAAVFIGWYCPSHSNGNVMVTGTVSWQDDTLAFVFDKTGRRAASSPVDVLQATLFVCDGAH